MGLNLAHFVHETALRYPDKVAIIADDHRLSYRELSAAIKKVASIVRDRGIVRGDKVALMVPNVPHFSIIYNGILEAGATVVPLNCMLKSSEIQHSLDDSDSKLLFGWQAFEEEFAKAFAEVESCHELIVVEPPNAAARSQSGLSFAELMGRASAVFDTVQTSPDDTAVILYTSGTTGRPKGAELSHFNLFFNAYYVRDYISRFTPNDVVLTVLPLFHSFAQTCSQNAPLMAGSTLTMVPSFDPRKMLDVIKRDRVTFMALVPSIYYFLANMKQVEASDLASLRLCVSGGAALPVAVFHEFKRRFNLTLYEGYGLTETSPVASFNTEARPAKPGSIGAPIWGCDMRVTREDGQFANVGEVGEIVIRGHNLMKGYYKKPIATAEAIVNGWFHTGDMGKVDDEGYFYIVDRKKDMIIRNGMNVYPKEIEDLLHSHPAVLECAVVGIPDEARGEEVKAYVALRDGAHATEQDVLEYCRERLARYKCPRHVEFMPVLPKGPTGKILKKDLRTRNIG